MKSFLKPLAGNRKILLAAAIAAAGVTMPQALAVDYSWNNSATGSTLSGLWSVGTNWAPNSPSGGPTASDNIVTPALFGGIQVDLTNAAVTNWTYNSTTGQTIFGGTSSAALTISGTLSKSGNGGTLLFTDASASKTLALSVGSISVSGGNLSMGTRAGTALTSFAANSAVISGGSLWLNVSGSAAITGSVTLSGNGTLNLAQGTSTTRQVSVGALSSASGAGAVAANDFTAANNSNATLILTAASGTATYSGTLRNSNGASTGSSLALQKNGAGTQILTGNSNTYSGGTVINAGTLLVRNTAGSATGTGAVSVNNGGTLGGGNTTTGLSTLGGASRGTYAAGVEGIISGTVAVAAGGKLSPGNSVGTITLGSLTFNNLAIVDVEFNGTANDFTAVTGALTFNGTTGINLYAEGTTNPFATAGLYNLFSYSSLVGFNALTSLDVLNEDSGYTYTFVNNTTDNLIQLSVAVVPEPSTYALIALGVVAVVFRRRARQV